MTDSQLRYLVNQLRNNNGGSREQAAHLLEVYHATLNCIDWQLNCRYHSRPDDWPRNADGVPLPIQEVVSRALATS